MSGFIEVKRTIVVKHKISLDNYPSKTFEEAKAYEQDIDDLDEILELVGNADDVKVDTEVTRVA
jgi:hypothetical protein